MSDKIMPPVHPGEILEKEFLEPLGIGLGYVAEACGVSVQHIHEIVAGKRSITPDVAGGLAQCLGTSQKLWIGLQEDYLHSFKTV